MADHCPNCGEKIRPDALLTWGGWHLDEFGKELFVGAERIRLTSTATDAMASLMRAQGRVVSKDGIYGAMYSTRPESDQPEMKIVDVYMCKLKKLHPAIYPGIETVWGRGYRLVPLPEPHVPRETVFLPLLETPVPQAATVPIMVPAPHQRSGA